MILVTGGAGFIGSHIVEAILAAGQETVVLDNFASGEMTNLSKDAKLVEADIANSSVVDIIAALKPEFVVHAAAQVSVAASMKSPAQDRAVNVEGTENVLAGANAAGTRRFVFLSSGGGVYGESDRADEKTLPRPKSYYSAHKYLAERYVEFSAPSYAIARLANVYGPRQRADLEGGVVSIFMDRLRDKLPIQINGTGEQRRDFVYIADVVDAILAMITSEHNGVWNVGTGRATSVLELLRSLEGAVGSAVEVCHGPRRAGDVKNSCLSIEGIRSDLGWQPRYDLAAGVAHMHRSDEKAHSS